MTPKEKARLRGFWTNKKTGKYFAVVRVTEERLVYIREVDDNRIPIPYKNRKRTIIWIEELERDYLKGIREVS